MLKVTNFDKIELNKEYHTSNVHCKLADFADKNNVNNKKVTR